MLTVLSRTIVYLHCSTNNEASTVMASYLDACMAYPFMLGQTKVERTLRCGGTCWSSISQNLQC